MNNSARNRVFGKTKWSGEEVNQHFSSILRLVIDPRYRGAGVAADFCRAVCQHAITTRFVEGVMSMGRVNQFVVRAGFHDCGPLANAAHGAYGSNGQKGMFLQRSQMQSKMSRMNLYLLDRKEHGWMP
jgi:hypothetical protein